MIKNKAGNADILGHLHFSFSNIMRMSSQNYMRFQNCQAKKNSMSEIHDERIKGNNQ